MSELAILVPVLARPHRVRPLLESICETVPEGTRVVFVCDPDDHPEQRAIHASLHDREYGPLKVTVLLHGGGYAAKINAAVSACQEPLLFFGADDLAFCEGWFDRAVETLGDRVEVVGVNDLIERDLRPEHATHFLVTRRYAELPTIDDRPGPLFDGYKAWFADDEFIATATKRGVYRYSADVHVEHLHHVNGKAFDDDVYRKGRAHAREDRRKFRGRQHLWR